MWPFYTGFTVFTKSDMHPQGVYSLAVVQYYAWSQNPAIFLSGYGDGMLLKNLA